MGGTGQSTTSSISSQQPATAEHARRELTADEKADLIEQFSSHCRDATQRRFISLLAAANGNFANVPKGVLESFNAFMNFNAVEGDFSVIEIMDEEGIERGAASSGEAVKQRMKDAFTAAGGDIAKIPPELGKKFDAFLGAAELEVHILSYIPSCFHSPFCWIF
jgi:hypothetical protein